MVFDFFGSKKKVIIAMAHIGAMPGSPLYDEKGGMQKLIERKPDATYEEGPWQVSCIDAGWWPDYLGLLALPSVRSCCSSW